MRESMKAMILILVFILVLLVVVGWLDSDPFTRRFTPTLEEWDALQERVEELENHTSRYHWDSKDFERTSELPEWWKRDFREDTSEMPLYLQQNNDCGMFHY